MRSLVRLRYRIHDQKGIVVAGKGDTIARLCSKVLAMAEAEREGWRWNVVKDGVELDQDALALDSGLNEGDTIFVVPSSNDIPQEPPKPSKRRSRKLPVWRQIAQARRQTLGEGHDEIPDPPKGPQDFLRSCLRCGKRFKTPDRYVRLCGDSCRKQVSQGKWQAWDGRVLL